MRLIGSQQQALALLARIGVALVIDSDGDLLAMGFDLGDCLGDQVVMLHGLYGKRQPRQQSHFPCPEAGGIDHDLGLDRAAGGDHIPAAIGAGVGLGDRGSQMDGGAIMLGRFGIGMSDAGGIDMAIHRLKQRPQIFGRVDEGVERACLLQADELRIEPHIAGLGALLLQIVQALGRGSEINAARAVDATGLA